MKRSENYDREFGDNIRKEDKRLKHKWAWHRSASGYETRELKKWTHFQCAGAKFGDWEMESIQWGSGESVRYEARIEYHGHEIRSKVGFDTRIEAQLGAEKLLVDWIRGECKAINEYTN